MKTTANLRLKKPEGTDVVNIDDFNYNVDVIDTELQKRALKTDIPIITVQSVNGKTGAVTLAAADIGAATSAQGIKADTALQSSQLGEIGGPAKQDDLVSHLADNTKHITSTERDAWNSKQNALGYTPINKNGDTMNGILTAQSNTSYTVRQVRNMILSPNDPDINAMQDGDIWVKYV